MIKKEKQNEKDRKVIYIGNNIPTSLIDKIKGVEFDLIDDDSTCEMYRMYEYSDNINILDEGINYPGLINYLQTGILSETELTAIFIQE